VNDAVAVSSQTQLRGAQIMSQSRCDTAMRNDRLPGLVPLDADGIAFRKSPE